MIRRVVWIGGCTRRYTTTTTATTGSAAKKETPLTPTQFESIQEMLRVDQAGELAADAIYRGQLFALKETSPMKPLIQHMWDQEKHHRVILDTLCANNRVRPSVLSPVWYGMGFALGAGTALLGEKAAMMCTEVVEEVIGVHYNDQIRELVKIPDNESAQTLAQVIKVLRDEELEHRTHALQHDAKQAPLYDPLSFIIRTGCQGAIWVASRF
ncbi:ubiquinone biosynthesis protein [Rhizoclosmatium globosum]|uniref:5-demethoxyubiquinone hydroxylase, mitochondrial n=1 Tax=Rhizoclosmatium globosum TaxID=329046 RepID=A0A1Y2C538_9FUNG|nr:ubiquinone biosynthesis protein [Rhizoclosmatium globosum]|eukprot:ORY42153.1 ubiquinone biosynthesis protein [Rhizoclosmatium globosum]